MRTAHRFALASLLLVVTACAGPGSQTPTTGGSLTPACAATPAFPSDIHLDPFYATYCMAGQLPVIASDVVPDAALRQARAVVLAMSANVPAAAVDAIAADHVRVGVIGVKQVTTDMPEHADLNSAFPNTDWDTRTRGVSATVPRPLTSVGEENVLCYASDPYAGESILVHEFAHTIMDLGMTAVDPTFAGRVQAAYHNAMNAGLWQGTYAAKDDLEYWAEGVQSYFDANQSANADHNGIDTRGELQAYDPALYALIDGVFQGSPAPALCP